MENATAIERAAYVADMTAQLAALAPDLPEVALALKLVALDAALFSIRDNSSPATTA